MREWFPHLLTLKEGYNMFKKLDKLLAGNILVIGGYPIKAWLIIGASLGAFVAWVLMAAIFAIF